MLPRATTTRLNQGTGIPGASAGVSQEIQRLIGRSLRAVTDLEALGERTVTIDCDVLMADGGTRTAAITGGYVALHLAMNTLVRHRVLPRVPLRGAVAATSVGILDGELALDLCYEEDFLAQVDFNVVSTDKGEVVEMQGATEAHPFPRHMVEEVLSLACRGMERLFDAQRRCLTNPSQAA